MDKPEEKKEVKIEQDTQTNVTVGTYEVRDKDGNIVQTGVLK